LVVARFDVELRRFNQFLPIFLNHDSVPHVRLIPL
jgi:hypothetical protein